MVTLTFLEVAHAAAAAPTNGEGTFDETPFVYGRAGSISWTARLEVKRINQKETPRNIYIISWTARLEVKRIKQKETPSNIYRASIFNT
jgi:hypothetical protein